MTTPSSLEMTSLNALQYRKASSACCGGTLKLVYNTVLLMSPFTIIDAFIFSPSKLNLSTSNLQCVISPYVSFSSPLIEDGYVPAVLEAKNACLKSKPLLLYLPGFDGTLLAPFLQFPELSTEFEVKGMTVGMDDRSTVEELRNGVLNYIASIVNEEGPSIDWSASKGRSDKKGRPVYIIGESFGGILTLEVALAIEDEIDKGSNTNINLQGIVLINPATSYDRSNLFDQGPPLTKLPSILYPFALLSIIPLFTDSYALPQLVLMLKSEALPSIIDTAQREAYMGRFAFSLPSKLKFMPRDTLKWRLNEWLLKGCKSMASQEGKIKELFRDLPVLVVAGEVDETLPSVSEAERLLQVFPDVSIHVVQGSGHGTTSGSRVDLTALMRNRFQPLQSSKARKQMKEVATKGKGLYFGMEPRYDGANIGLSPLLYWTQDYYQQI